LTDALYTIASVLDTNQLEDLKHFKTTVGSKAALVTNGRDGKPGGHYDDLRKAEIKEIRPKEFPDVCESILDMIELHRPHLSRENHLVKEFNYLMYEIGGHFVKHKDWLNRENGDPKRNRLFSTITLIDKSEDLDGGDLYIWPEEPDADGSLIELELGETVIFNSMRMHQVTPIVQGTREALVAWIYLK